MAKRAAAKRKARPVDFDDEESVLAEVAADLGYEPEDLKIEEDRGFTGFGEGTVYRIESGNKEWMVAENDEQSRALAIAVVTQDLEQEPEIFNKDFLESHIDKERLARDLRSDVHSERYDYLSDLGSRNPDEFWELAEGEGMTVPDRETDEDGDDLELREPTSGEVDELADKLTDELMRDPMAYLADIYGDKEAVEQAIKIAGIDITAAAEDAVDTDGEGHFLSHYDGHMHDTPAGLVYWRTN